MRESKSEERAVLLAECVKASGTVRLRVFGSSMWPALRAGDEVTLRRVAVSVLRSGCIVAVMQEGRLLVHRLVEITVSGGKTVLVTRGDTLAEKDPAVTAEEFLGIVESVTRKGRVVQLRSFWQRMLNRGFAGLAPLSRFWFPAALAVKRFLGLPSRPPRVSDTVIF